MSRSFKSLMEKFKNTAKPDKSTVVDFTGKFRVGRGSGGFAFHVIEGNEWKALCGTAVVERKSEITADRLVEQMPSQHEGFFYCSVCTTAFTGLSREDQQALRYPQK